jgi:serine/threonine-protein kinase
MGTVYVGVQLSVDREVAIKVIHPKLASDRNAVKRFLREARLASRLNQASIVNVYDFGQSEGVLFLVTELVRGHTLAQELERARPLPFRRVVAIAVQLCDALEAAHAQDIVHRDLKPGNIILVDDLAGRDLVKVLDFGLAKSLGTQELGSHITTNVGGVLGTPMYMSPEQIEGRPTDPRSDLYALGCIIYEMATGAPPFVDDAISTVLARHIGDPPAPLPEHIPRALRMLVEQLLAKSAADRPQNATEVRALLERMNEHGAFDTGPVPRSEQRAFAATEHDPPTPARGSRRAWLAALGVAAAVAVIAIVTLRGGDESTAKTQPAQPALAAAADAAIAHVQPTAVAIDAGAATASAVEDASVERDATAIAVPARTVHHVVPIKHASVHVEPRADAGVDLEFLH